jgi:hypothetical protein
MSHSKGVSLRNRAAGLHRWRDETKADGGIRYLRHCVRARGKLALRRLIAEECS